MKSIKITLWQNEREYAVLQAALARNGTSVEGEMQEQLARLYRQTIPLEEQRSISEAVRAEMAVESQQWDDSQPVTVFHIKEHRQEHWLLQRQRTEFLYAAILLRNYRRAHIGNMEHYTSASFADTLVCADSITPEQFDQLVSERRENTGRVAGAFDIDLDRGEFSALNIMEGWKTYRVQDVTDAALHATLKKVYSDSERWELFLDRLDGREVTAGNSQRKPPKKSRGTER